MNDWDKYWLKKKEATHIIFDRIAGFYRRRIIPRILNFFIEKNYEKSAVLLHAGCGSGLVDKKASKRFKLISLDISMPALRMNKFSHMLIQGNVLHLPIKDKSIDGIYNLGVMEHFNEKEIAEILKEFDTVLKSRGKITLFWPPEFGLSTIFLKVVHFILNNILKRNMKLSPDEITRIKSPLHIKSICEKAGLKLIDYYFGPKDLFTYVVVTLEKNS